jgi:hypothetical protein
MKSLKKYHLAKIISIFVILVLGTISMLSIESKFNPQTNSEAPIVKRKTKTIYPTQYSDDHITSNAVISEPRFKELGFFDKETLLASTISNVVKNPNLDRSKTEKGTWLWTPIIEITPKYAEYIVNGAKKNGVNTIYMSVDSYLDIFVMAEGNDKSKKRETFDKNISDFITLAKKNGISVDAEAGWRNWAEDGNTYKAFTILNYVKNYNSSHEAKFRGFQYDIEPYLLSRYEINKTSVLKNYLDLIGESVIRLNNTDLLFSVVIPEFYDGTNNDTPNFTYLGKSGFAIDHLISLLNRRVGSEIIVMSYRNFSKGDDGTVEISQDEINKANLSKTKVIIAQETGDVKPPYVTFHDTSKAYLTKQIDNIQKSFGKDKSFGGVAIHYANAYLDLK